MGGRNSSHRAVDNLPTTRTALALARRLHAGQRREADGAEFILHPLEVATLLHRAGAPDHVIAAGALHDTLEKTAATPEDLRERFGDRVTGLVLAVTEDERIKGYAARKAALRQQVAGAGREALQLFAADKVSKVRELDLAGSGRRAADSAKVRKRRLVHYRQCLALLDALLPDDLLVAELRDRVNALTAEAAAPPALAGSH